MVILQVTDSLGNGGAEKFLVELSNELSKDHQVIICTAKPIKDWMLPPKLINKRVKLIDLNLKRKISISQLVIFIKQIRILKPDIIHIHSSILMFYFILFPCIFRKIKYIHTVHNTLTPAYKRLFSIIYPLRLINNQFTHVCISSNIYEKFSLRYPNLNFKHVNNGINRLFVSSHINETRVLIDSLKRTAKSTIFIAIGNYSDSKNFCLLASVFQQLEKAYDIILIMLGRGNKKNNANFEDVKLIKGVHTHQLGLVNNIGDYLDCADVLVMSSINEGMPLVVLEAMSMGLPIVSTPAGGLQDMITKENGILSDNFTEQSLTSAIEQFLKLDENKRQQIGDFNQNQFGKKYSPQICTKAYLTLYS